MIKFSMDTILVQFYHIEFMKYRVTRNNLNIHLFIVQVHNSHSLLH